MARTWQHNSSLRLRQLLEKHPEQLDHREKMILVGRFDIPAKTWIWRSDTRWSFAIFSSITIVNPATLEESKKRPRKFWSWAMRRRWLLDFFLELYTFWVLRTVNRGNFGRILDVASFLLRLMNFLHVRQCLEEVNCKFLLSTAWHTARNQASCSVRIYPGKWGKFWQPQNLNTNPYSEILWFLKFQDKAWWFFCTRRVQRPHKWTY